MSTPRRTSTLCASCRKLISTEAATCPFCGARRPGAFGSDSRIRRLLAEDLVEATAIICAAVYVLHLGLTFLVDRAALTHPASFFDIGGPSGRVAMLAGGTGAFAMPHRPWTLFTANFVHLSLLHIAFNMMWLLDLGRMASHLWGTARFVIVFTLTGVGGFLFSNGMSGVPTAGASCALFGLMGALAVWGYRIGGTAGEALKQRMVRWLIFCALIGFGMGGVNHWGHAGGVLVGLGLGAWIPTRAATDTPRWVALGAIVCVVLNVLSLLAVLVEWHLYSALVFRSG